MEGKHRAGSWDKKDLKWRGDWSPGETWPRRWTQAEEWEAPWCSGCLVANQVLTGDFISPLLQQFTMATFVYFSKGRMEAWDDRYQPSEICYSLIRMGHSLLPTLWLLRSRLLKLLKLKTLQGEVLLSLKLLLSSESSDSSFTIFPSQQMPRFWLPPGHPRPLFSAICPLLSLLPCSIAPCRRFETYCMGSQPPFMVILTLEKNRYSYSTGFWV